MFVPTKFVGSETRLSTRERTTTGIATTPAALPRGKTRNRFPSFANGTKSTGVKTRRRGGRVRHSGRHAPSRSRHAGGSRRDSRRGSRRLRKPKIIRIIQPSYSNGSYALFHLNRTDDSSQYRSSGHESIGRESPHNTDQTRGGAATRGVQVRVRPKSKGRRNEDITRRVVQFAPVGRTTPEAYFVPQSIDETQAGMRGRPVQIRGSPTSKPTKKRVIQFAPRETTTQAYFIPQYVDETLASTLGRRVQVVERPKSNATRMPNERNSGRVEKKPHATDQPLQPGHDTSSLPKDSDKGVVESHERVVLPHPSPSTPHVMVTTHNPGENLSNTPDLGDEVKAPESKHTVIYQRLQSTTPMVLRNTDQSLSGSHSTPKLTDTGMSDEESIGQVEQGAPVYETTTRVSVTPRNPEVALTGDSDYKVEGHADATDSDGSNQGIGRPATDSARNEETEPRDPAASTSRNAHGRGGDVQNPSESLDTGMSNEDNVRPVIRFAPVAETTPYVIPHNVYDTQASESGRGAKPPGSPKTKDGATQKDGSVRHVVILPPPDNRPSPQIVPHNLDETSGVMHRLPVQVGVDPRYEGAGIPDEGGGLGPGGGERGRMPVGRRGRVDSETGCKLTFSSTAWIACMTVRRLPSEARN